jgi:2-keto-4-pentenoate hydratase/2-oxohepta-3-ene-1,7-dioic acid hydratase (catechol pathway)
MNLLTVEIGGKREVAVQEKGRLYRFVEPDSKPADPVDAIRNWDNLLNADRAEISGKYRYCVPLVPGKMFLPAVNFRSHSSETSMPKLDEPYFFTKFSHTLVPHGGEVVKPRGIQRMDYEGEIGIIIGKRGKYIREENAMDHVFGYTIVDDVSLRDYQNSGHPVYGKDWVLGKNADTALPMGPWIVPKKEIEPFHATIQTYVNGKLRQNGDTDDMIFGPARLISRLSMAITLEPGDLISTGTPSGVAEYGSKEYLNPGDTVEITVSGIGTLRHTIVADSS